MGSTPRDEMDALLDALLRFGQQMLDKHGEFYPYAAALDSSGELQMVAAADPGDEHPDSSELIELLYQGLMRQASAGEIRAAGVCADVRVSATDSPQMTDAIKVAIEHTSSDPVEVFLPYVKRKFRGTQYGELFAQPGTARVFSP
jgi:hypothetical protein